VFALCAHAHLTPGGESGCVTEIDEAFFHMEHVGENIVVTTPSKKIVVPPCKTGVTAKHGDAWKAWAQYQNDSNITSIYSKWIVPAAPTESGQQTLFYWNGVEPTDNSAVLQPVLQYGFSAAGGGEYWTLASWFVSGSHGSFWSKLTRVETGDIIEGTNEILKNGTWVITGAVKAKGITTSFSYKPNFPAAWTYAYEALEAYTIDDCPEYPAAGVISFTDIVVQAGGQTVTPKWQPLTQDPITCKEHATVVDPTRVDIYF